MNDLVTLTENKEIVYASFILRKNGLEPVGTPNFEQWLECGQFINRAKGAVHFWIGDWLNYGEQQWGEKYLEAIKTTGYQYQTLADDKWVAARVQFSRRRENLSFDHHKTIAGLDAEEQEVLLKDAVEKKLDSKTFRKYVEKRELPQHQQKPQRQEPDQERENKKLDVSTIIDSNNILLAQLADFNPENYPAEETNYLFLHLRITAERIKNLLEQHEND